MELNKYQQEAVSTAIYGSGYKINYPILGLLGEAGELANKYKKVLRDDNGILSSEKREELKSELGDCLWYMAALATDLDTSLDIIANDNLVKLRDRQQRNKIQGSGDNR